MMDKIKNTTRVQLELPSKSMDRLSQLKEITEASSNAEVIRNALRLYESIIYEVESGHKIMVEDEEGKTVEYKIFT